MLTAKEQLISDIGGFTHDPLGFVLYAFEWGKGELEKYPHGPDVWQREVLNDIGEKLKQGYAPDAAVMAVLESVSSGKGVGKSCLIAWLILWAISTFEDTRGIVTANTDTQLRTKTWPELSKWYRCCITRDWFTLTATSIYSVDKDHEKTWKIDAIPWSKENTEAFAGLHNKGKRILLVFDEASAIDDKIWEVADYALTDSDTEIIWVACGNPTRNTGRFIECSGKYRHRWKSYSVDSRTVRITNKAQIAQWIEDEGEDSDVIRVNVRGLPPRSSMLEFIGPEDVDKCMAYRAESYESFPVIIGMDCARFGDDYNTIYTRQGRKVKFHRKWRGLDTQQSAAYLVEAFSDTGAEVAFVDGGGPGGGVIDRAKVLIGPDKVIEINFGGEARDKARYANKRAEMWGDARDAMRAGLELPNEPELRTDLLGPLYTFTNKQQILLEKKSDMKKRGLASPDHGDGFVLTFAQPVISSHTRIPAGVNTGYNAMSGFA
jgi:hypothetical protein